MNLEHIKLLIELRATAISLNEQWSEAESVDWSQAEEFVGIIAKTPRELRQERSILQEILDYAQQNDDWDSGEVASWPDIIVELTDNPLDKAYDHRADGDNWEVFALAANGEEEWKATCETESIAERLVTALSN